MRTFLESQHASTRNLIPSTMDPSDVVQAFDPDWNGGVPYSVVIAPGGKIIYRKNGPIKPQEVKKVIADHLGRTY